MKKIISIFVIVLIASTTLFSQSVYVDKAFKFSSSDYGGTARFVGMGGAFGALGGDFSSISINPAGIGVYRSSELVFSPGLTYNSNSSNYLTNSLVENGYGINVNNMGFVVSNDLVNTDSRWVNFNFGVGFNRINDFNNDVQFQGINNTSLMEIFVTEANDAGAFDPYYLDELYEFIIWDAYLMNDTIAGEYYSEITDEVWNDPANFEILQRKIIQTEGSISEYNFSFGGNYANKLYVGASIGITRLRYSEYSSHFEQETAGLTIPFINSFDFKEYSDIKGTGFTFKVGAIYRPLEFLRIGASLHLPTFYNLDQRFYNSAMGYFDNVSPEYSESAEQVYKYELSTPLKAMGSIGIQIGKIALVDVDYEYVDYSTMEMADQYNSQEVVEDNASIRSTFQATHNIRAGFEIRTGPIYYRAGGRYSTSPYKEVLGSLNNDYEKITLAGGLGYREKNFFIDFAFAQTSYSYKMIAYDLSPYYTDFNFSDNAVATIDHKLNNFILTFGIKF